MSHIDTGAVIMFKEYEKEQCGQQVNKLRNIDDRINAYFGKNNLFVVQRRVKKSFKPSTETMAHA